MLYFHWFTNSRNMGSEAFDEFLELGIGNQSHLPLQEVVKAILLSAKVPVGAPLLLCVDELLLSVKNTDQESQRVIDIFHLVCEASAYINPRVFRVMSICGRSRLCNERDQHWCQPHQVGKWASCQSQNVQRTLQKIEHAIKRTRIKKREGLDRERDRRVVAMIVRGPVTVA
jgi:hypothetical protein